MVILGIGVDLVSLSRIAALLERRGRKFPSRILSYEEFSRWDSLRDDDRRVRSLAVHWALKEAAYKALYPTVQPSWKELAYQPLSEESPRTKPALIYQPFSHTNKSKIGPMHMSVSHDGDYVFACVTVETPA